MSFRSYPTLYTEEVYISEPNKNLWRGFWDSAVTSGVRGTVEVLLTGDLQDLSILVAVTYLGTYRNGSRVLINLDRIPLEPLTFQSRDRNFTIVVTEKTPTSLSCTYTMTVPRDRGTMTLNKTGENRFDLNPRTDTSPRCTLL